MQNEKQELQKVIVVDFDMPFRSMINFMVKWTIAAIPALIILFIFGVAAVMLLSAFTGVKF
jgi:hypothetical protein